MKSLPRWLETHPITAVLFATLFTMISTALAFRDDWQAVGIWIFAGLLVVFAFVMFCQMWRGVLVMILVATFAVPRIQADNHGSPLVLIGTDTYQQEPPREDGGTGGGPAAGCAAVVVAIVVIVVAGIIIYKIVKFCQKAFPPSSGGETNQEPAGFVLSGPSSGDTDSAAFNFGEIGSCGSEDPCADGSGGGVFNINNSTTFSLTLRVENNDDGELIIFPLQMRADKGLMAVRTWPEFVRDTAALGVEVTGHAGHNSWARNGRPIPESKSPIRWDPVRQLAKVEQGSPSYYTVVVERSKDMKTWGEVLKTEVGVGSTIQIQDTTPNSQHFYRYRGFLSD